MANIASVPYESKFWEVCTKIGPYQQKLENVLVLGSLEPGGYFFEGNNPNRKSTLL